jgi:hypothetical protein
MYVVSGTEQKNSTSLFLPWMSYATKRINTYSWDRPRFGKMLASVCVRSSMKLSNIGRSSDGWPKIISRSSVLRKAHKPLVQAAFAVSTRQPALGPRGGLWPVLLLESIRKACAPAAGTLIGWCGHLGNIWDASATPSGIKHSDIQFVIKSESVFCDKKAVSLKLGIIRLSGSPFSVLL